MRRKVSIAAGGGMSHEEIAIGLGISRNTLEKHFERELSVAAYERRLEVLSAMYGAAVKGNVTAQRAYLQVTPRSAAPPAPLQGEEVAPKQPAMGKKEQQAADAVTAHVATDWESLMRGPAIGPAQ